MNILFFGLPEAALGLLEDGQHIVHAAICRKDADGLDSLRQKLGAEHVSVLPQITPAWAQRMAPEGVDLIISWFWTKKLPLDVLALARIATLGVHPSLLPRHRGPDPIFHAIDAGDTVTGVSAHVLAGEYDVGDVYAQRELAIDPSWNGWQLAQALDAPSLALLRELALRFKEGDVPAAIPQPGDAITQAPMPSEEELELDASWSSERIVRRVRAAAPWPGAWIWFGDEVLTLTHVELAERRFDGVPPGTGFVWQDQVYLATADGALRVLAARVGEAEDAVEGDALVKAVRDLAQGA